MKQRDLHTAIEILRGWQDERRGALKEQMWDPGRPEMDLRGEDLRGLKFELDYVKRKELDLAGTDFRGADLRGARMQGIELREADFQGADLRGAKLQKASLVGANFEGADLRGASFRGANLKDANLEGAISDQHTFRGARMNGEPTLWETVQQKARAWADRQAERKQERLKASAEPGEEWRRAADPTGVRKVWEQTVSQPLERAKQWLGVPAVVERVENWRDDRIKEAAERAYPAEEVGGDATARVSSSPAPSPATQAGRDPAVGQHLEPAARPLTHEEGRAAYNEVIERQEEIKTTIAGMADPAERAKAERLLATVQQDAAARQRSPERGAELDR